MVTGGPGYCGRHIVAALATRGERVVSYNRDYAESADEQVTFVQGELYDLPRLLHTIETHGVARIVHTVAMSHPDLSIEFPIATFQANVGCVSTRTDEGSTPRAETPSQSSPLGCRRRRPQANWSRGQMRRIRAIQFVAVVVAASCLAIASAAAARAAHFSVSTRRALTSIAVSGMGAGAMPGLEVGVWVPGEGSFVRAFGTGDLATRSPLQLGDHFRIANISKSFTATAILRLVDQHRFSLGAHLSDFIRGIQHGNQITVAQLLDMTSGIYDYVSDSALLHAYARNPRRPFSLHDVVSIIKHNKPMFAPGAKAVYDNSNYYLLGAIAQNVTHEPLGKVIQTEILRRLRLRHTSYPTSAAMPAPFSHGYLDQPDFPPRDVTASNPVCRPGASPPRRPSARRPARSGAKVGSPSDSTRFGPVGNVLPVYGKSDRRPPSGSICSCPATGPRSRPAPT
jgi:CubicO group peptidase (beta-lactamase class C family)